ncbi:MAG TPA: tetratricopeptide repeat protein, partial [Dissulfurispiraceae bacterium]|nr:tetratricopeptide repeat protein [Dissulfurispiraceae bacterium]
MLRVSLSASGGLVPWRFKGFVQCAVLLGCLTVLLLGCNTDPEKKSQKHFARGQKDLAEQKLDEAIIEFRNALQAVPKFAEAHNQLGRAYQ